MWPDSNREIQRRNKVRAKGLGRATPLEGLQAPKIANDLYDSTKQTRTRHELSE